ncbi:MAG: anhydro-N-acetylmuramic acid kinase [Armatimonadetes bacterium]|nr:anhydro-N-acetylmuramic acid kinase [Armatimonadota bacterium]
MYIIGLMSGTSADGIDAALTEIQGEFPDIQVRLVAFACRPHAPEIREAILSLCSPEGGRMDRLCGLNAALGESFAEAALEVSRSAGVPMAAVSLIGSHGQTVWHQPEPVRIGPYQGRSTLQVGEPAIIAERTGVTVVADFRPADMAAGGQGAPLTPFADYLFFRDQTKGRAIQNIGGIANVTYLPPGAAPEEVIAFDTGPGNMVIDALVAHFSGGQARQDADGAGAARGRIRPALLGRWLKHPFFHIEPPKSTGREQFGAGFVRACLESAPEASPEDLLATATALTAESIASAYRRWVLPRGPAHEIVLGGGGIHNLTLRSMLAERLSPIPIRTHADYGLPDKAKEAVAFALLAYAAARGIPGNIPSATGAARPAVLGKIIPGKKGWRPL